MSNEKQLQILTAMTAAAWCFLIDNDLATPAELEALTRQALNVMGENADVQKLFEELDIYFSDGTEVTA